MVKLKGPGMALAASGSLAKQLTFSNWKGKAYMKIINRPTQPNTAGQIAMRAMMRFLSTEWSNLNDNQQATYNDLAEADQISPFNAFEAFNLARWRNRLPPSKSYPAAQDNFAAADPWIGATAGVRHVDIEVYEDALIRDNWTFLLFHSTAGIPDPNWDNLIHVFKVEDLNSYYFSHTPLTAGNHHYRTTVASDDGKIDLARTDTDSAVVT